MRPSGTVVVSMLALTWGMSAHVLAGGAHIPRRLLVPPVAGAAPRAAQEGTAATSPVRVEQVRLEALPAPTTPSTVLKFDLINGSASRVTDLVLEISIEEKTSDRALKSGRVVVGPFTIRTGVVLEPGYTVNYEMLLRNFSPDDSCAGRVEVRSARSLPEPQ